jgi:hypothetical protein
MIALTQTSPRTDVTRPFGVILLLALIAMGLSACGGGSSGPPGSTNTNYGELNTKGNVTTTQPEARRRPENSKSRTTTAAIPFKPVPNASLKGLSEPEVEAKIGEPEMIRGEGDIRVWQYRSDQCSFDAFFAPATEGAPRELRHMLARMRRGNQPITVQDCLDQVVKKNLARG